MLRNFLLIVFLNVSLSSNALSEELAPFSQLLELIDKEIANAQTYSTRESPVRIDEVLLDASVVEKTQIVGGLAIKTPMIELGAETAQSAQNVRRLKFYFRAKPDLNISDDEGLALTEAIQQTKVVFTDAINNSKFLIPEYADYTWSFTVSRNADGSLGFLGFRSGIDLETKNSHSITVRLIALNY
ncbi:MAG: hypothetical protein JJ959_13070 [Nisaea sp.]|uniref:hypothetical protein n=1 Tax=Nisaea sp. TaxID=2024842 RepID=UPI001B296523|nr:hypothetical protein [Nisaea sp.]MBO6561467.1 hypothetical protein [Nisaea sp.]